VGTSDGWTIGLDRLESFAVELEFLRWAVNFRLGGAVRAAWAERWRVMLLMPTSMCFWSSGGGGGGGDAGASSFVGGFVSFCAEEARLRFLLRLPFEGWMWVFRY